MTSLCVRCEQTGDISRMVMVVNPWHNGPSWIDVCTDCIILGDRVVGPEDEPDGDEPWGDDTAAELLERGPR